MTRILFIRCFAPALASLAIVSCSLHPAVTRPDSALTRLVTAVAEDGQGCAFSIRRDNRLVREGAAGFRDRTRKEKLSPDDLFDVGSVSKSFTAAVVLELQRKSDLSLQAPVSDYVSGLPGWGSDVTIADLLYMRSGVPEFLVGDPDTAGWRGDRLFGTDLVMEQQVTADRIMQAIRSIEHLDFKPGSMYAYSNSNYMLLRAAAEKAAGKPFRELMTETASEMADVGIRISDFENGRRLSPSLVSGYDLSDAGTAEPFMADWDVLGASSVWISVHDLARWGEGLLSDPARFAAYSRIGAQRAPEEDKSRSYAAGLMTMDLEGDSVVYHLGGTEGFSSGMFLWPRRSAVLAFSCNMSPDLIISRGLESEARDMFVQYQELVFLHAWAADQRSNGF